MKNRLLVSSIGLSVLVFASVAIAEGVSLKGVQCLLAPKDAKEANSADWKDGKVYFCCGGCKGKFEKMTKEEKEKMAAKSNSQLVSTKQYEQKACPLSGGDLNKDAALEINGSTVLFCCNGCKGKVEKMEADEKLEAVFSEKAFKAAKFEKVESK